MSPSLFSTMRSVAARHHAAAVGDRPPADRYQEFDREVDREEPRGDAGREDEPVREEDSADSAEGAEVKEPPPSAGDGGQMSAMS